MKTQMNIRVGDSQRQLLKEAARMAKESFTEFLLNSAMLRIQNRQLETKPLDPLDLVGRVYLEPYDASKLPKKAGRDVEALLERDRQGLNRYQDLGTVRVRPPKRSAKR